MFQGWGHCSGTGQRSRSSCHRQMYRQCTGTGSADAFCKANTDNSQFFLAQKYVQWLRTLASDPKHIPVVLTLHVCLSLVTPPVLNTYIVIYQGRLCYKTVSTIVIRYIPYRPSEQLLGLHITHRIMWYNLWCWSVGAALKCGVAFLKWLLVKHTLNLKFILINWKFII